MIRLSTHPGRQQLPKAGEKAATICARTVKGWQTQEFLTLESLAAHVDRGASVAPVFTDGHAQNDSFAETWLIALDCDDPGEFEAVCANEWIQQYTRVSGETKSSTPEAVCGRVFLILDAPLREVLAVRSLTDRVLYRLEADQIDLHDKGVKDAFRPYFGFKTGTTRIATGRLLTLAELFTLPDRPVAIESPRELRREAAPSPAGGSSIDWEAERALWHTHEIIPHLDVVSPVVKPRGQYRNCPNPNHTDSNPSFRISFQKRPDGYPVCSCGLHHEKDAWGKVAEWVGARDLKTWFKEERRQFYAPAARQTQTNPTPAKVNAAEAAPAMGATNYHAGGVPNSWRSALLSLPKGSYKNAAAGALVYEHLTNAIRAGSIDPNSFTIKEVIATTALHGMSPKTTRNGCTFLVNLDLFPKLPTEIDTESVGKIGNNSPSRGRTSELYRLAPLDKQAQRLIYAAAAAIRQRVFTVKATPYSQPTLATLTIRALAAVVGNDHAQQVAATLESARVAAYERQGYARVKASRKEARMSRKLMSSLKELHSSPLPDGWSLATPSAYRVAFLRAVEIETGGGAVSKSEIAQLIGMTPRSANKYVEAAGCAIETNQTASVSITQPGDIEKQVRSIAYEVKGKPLHLEVRQRDGGSVKMSYSRDAANRASQAIAAGASVTVVLQTANKHTVLDVPPPQPPARAQQAKLPTPAATTAETWNPTRTRAIDDLPVIETGYDPAWVRAQLLLAFEVQGWRTSAGVYFNPNTGEIVPPNASAAQIIAVYLDTMPASGDPSPDVSSLVEDGFDPALAAHRDMMLAELMRGAV